MRKISLVAVAVLVLASGALRADVNPKNFDLTVKPQDDFYRFVNGTYLKSTALGVPMPSCRSATRTPCGSSASAPPPRAPRAP
jgi:hypothetical protein